MKSTVDVMMVENLNQILKKEGIAYSLHTVGGCSCCGLYLRCDGATSNPHKILEIINTYLTTKWLIASFQEDDPSMLYIDSKFDKK